MAKPWSRTEIGYLGHRKFLALTANAICLWHEGKQYCDTHLTDGLIPKEALKLFRFFGTKSLSLLMTSCGNKPDGSPFAPLWEAHDVGYRMHDYLDHNDCREKVLARIDDAKDAAELRRAANAKRQQELRAKRKAEIQALRNGDVTPDVTPNVTRTCATPTETPTPTPTTKKEREDAPRPRPMAPIHDRSHIKHAHCGRTCLPAALFGEFVRRRNTPNADREIREWALTVERAWSDGGPFASAEPGDAFEFWKARYAEQWPTAAIAKPVTGPRTISAKDHPYAYRAEGA